MVFRDVERKLESAVRTILFLLPALLVVSCALAYWRRAILGRWAEGLISFFHPEEKPAGHPLWSLFLVSFAALYVEIMLIRWIGTEVRVFAYFQNLALIACFLGFGLGCYWAQRKKSLLFSLAAVAALVLLVEIPSDSWKGFLLVLSAMLSLSPDAAMWGFLQATSISTGAFYVLFAASLVTVAVFLLLLVAAMIPVGQWVGFYLDRARNPIHAYSVNLLGSLAGIWVFAGMAFLWLPPEYWFCVAFFLLMFIPPISRRLSIAGILLLAASLFALHAAQDSTVETHWSPYQKLELRGLGDQEYTVQVNNTGYMTIANVSPDFLSRNPEIAANYRELSSYDAPFKFARSRDRVLIVGAGAGNDAAAALRNGAVEVDAVEIDPVIYSLGKHHHPEHPYDSPRVHVALNDARAFLRQAQEKYDVIMFGLLDSHTQFSDFSNMRIDNYVYTEESFREARRLLKPDGILVLKFEVRPPWTWLGQRFYVMLDRIFDRAPVVFHAAWLGHMTSASVFIESNGSRIVAARAATGPGPADCQQSSAVSADLERCSADRDRRLAVHLSPGSFDPAHVLDHLPAAAGDRGAGGGRRDGAPARIHLVFFLPRRGISAAGDADDQQAGALLWNHLAGELRRAFGDSSCAGGGQPVRGALAARASGHFLRFADRQPFRELPLSLAELAVWGNRGGDAAERGLFGAGIFRGNNFHRLVPPVRGKIERVRREHRGSGAGWAGAKPFVRHRHEGAAAGGCGMLRAGRGL